MSASRASFISPDSPPFSACLPRSSAASSRSFVSADTLSPHSPVSFSTWYTSVSSELRASTASRRFSSSALFASASSTMRSISASLSPLDASMRTFCSFSVARSLAVTCRMPLASMSKVTSTCGMPLGAGGMPVSWNLPMVRLSIAILRSPCRTWISTVVCASSAVEKTSILRVGIVVLRSISVVITPPSVSMPSDSGVTSRSRTSFTSPASTPPWIAAPTATTSSGFTPRCGSCSKNSSTTCWILGIRVEPPTSTTSSMSAGFIPASSSALRIGGMVRWIRSSTRCSNFARESE